MTCVSLCILKDGDSERLNGYLYRQHTRDFLFTAAEWEDETKKDIKNSFVQDLSKYWIKRLFGSVSYYYLLIEALAYYYYCNMVWPSQKI